jgi:WD40 repeat protein
MEVDGTSWQAAVEQTKQKSSITETAMQLLVRECALEWKLHDIRLNVLCCAVLCCAVLCAFLCFSKSSFSSSTRKLYHTAISYLSPSTYPSSIHAHHTGTVTGLSRGVFAVDFSSDNEQVAIAGGDSSIRILKIGKEKKARF